MEYDARLEPLVRVYIDREGLFMALDPDERSNRSSGPSRTPSIRVGIDHDRPL